MGKNLHEKPFDEETLKKLDIFEAYTKEWIPPFLMEPHEPNLCIFDLFAGPGYSITDQEGSPIRILKQVENQIDKIVEKKKHVFLIFNEYDKDKFQTLKQVCKSFCEVHPKLKEAIGLSFLHCKVTRWDVESLYPVVKKFIGNYPLLLFLDQNGVKFMADEYLQPLFNAKKVDFMLFLSSTYFIRFGKTEEFKKILSIDVEEARKNPYTFIHRYLLDALKAKIPAGSETRLYPFSLKKGSNIYGIIFGTSHVLGAEKFLRMAWKENAINGEANFDIDDDLHKGQPDLFGYVEMTKMMKFKEDIRQAIISGRITNNKDAYLYALNHGHLPTHAANEIKQMKKDKIISYEERSPLVTYDKIFKENKIIKYNICAQQK